MLKKDSFHWWRTHFEDNPSLQHSHQLKVQVDGIENLLGLEPRSRILDLACGSGRQTLELSRRGHRVLGIESSSTPLAAARESARAEKLNAHFLRSDVRNLSYREEFDAAIIFSSLGYLTGERDDQKMLDGVHKCLKPGGRLMMDLMNKEWLMRHFEPNFWEPGEDEREAVVLDRISFNFETGRLDNHRTIVDRDGKRVPSFVSVRVYTLTELKGLIGRAGLDYRRVWGGFDGSIYGMDSPRMIVSAEKSSPRRSSRRRLSPYRDVVRIKGRSRKR